MRKRSSLGFAAVLAAMLVAPAAAAPLRALLFSGANNHDWRSTTPQIQRILEKSGRFEVRVVEEPAGATAATLASYDVLVLDYQGPRWGAATEKAVEAFVRGGKGLVVIHAASYAFGGLPVLGPGHKPTGLREPAWTAYGDMVGAVWSEQEPKTGHGPRHLFTVKPVLAEHPILRGVEPFAMHDELYRGFRMRPGVQVLATAFDDPKNQGTGKDEPMLWVVNYGKGRVFHTALGHDLAAMQTPGFMVTLARGAEWAASGAVTLSPRPPARLAANAVRVELISGGHDHDASFYGAFEEQPELNVIVNPHPDAFRNRILKETDVVVLYDMVQEIPEQRRQNIRQFVESGKGLVVTHHAIASFQDWRWWWEELVGGRYMLRAEMGLKPSTYLHDADMVATPVGKHPIIDGMGQFRIVDEAYKGMWLSPKATVLLKTDHPADDGPLLWISPYEKARVVYLKLGHDRQAHQHPMYRELLRRCILWAAGRM